MSYTAASSLATTAANFLGTVASMAKPWWTGVPTTLLAKTTLVNATATTLPVHTLTFAIPPNDNNSFHGPALPHRDIRIDHGDVVKLVIPGYKPKSYSVSALRDDAFDVTFKVYPNGRASGYLDRLQIGDTIHSFGMLAGRTRNPGPFVGIVAYGVGMTEALPVAAAELERGDAESVVLLWAARTRQDMFWAEEIRALEQEYQDKFRVVRILSRESVDGCRHGRIDASVLQEVFGDAIQQQLSCGTSTARFLSVGTKAMMHQTDQLLGRIGFAMPEHALLPKT